MVSGKRSPRLQFMPTADAIAMDRVRVLILGGWSPGPLDHLREQFANVCDFVEPGLHMPPSGVRWCCTWECMLLAASVYFACNMTQVAWQLRLVSIALSPLLVVLLVRGSIRRCISIANSAIAAHKIEVVVGFSWGGGIGCWLLHDRMWMGPTLLLAPTLDAMASAAWLPLGSAPFFSSDGRDNQALEREALRNHTDEDYAHASGTCDDPSVHMFHATFDGFCPKSQLDALRTTGASVYVCRDGHTLDSPKTLEEIESAFSDLCEMALGRRV